MVTHTPQYRIQLRDNTLTPIGELPDFVDGDVLLNFNDVGAFVLTVRADSPMASHFAAGNGVIISRDRGDGSGAQTILSGPIWHLERRLKDNTYVLSGPDDLWWLKARVVNPVVGYPYSATGLALANLLRYYRLGDTSGTSAVDSKSAANGTYTGGFTLNQTALIDDTNGAVLFNGTTGYVNVPTASLPAGNTSWYAAGWCKVPSSPSANATLIWLGANTGANKGVWVAMNTSRQIAVTLATTGTVITSSAISAGASHFIAVTWDGTTLTLYIDGASAGTATPGALALTYTSGGASLGANFNNAAPSQFWNGTLDEWAIGSGGALAAADVTNLYIIGKSRFAADAYDTRTGTASTIIRGYVNDNAAAGAVASRQVFGLTLAADPAIGSSVTGNARFDNLLALIQQLAVSGGDIGFKCVQTDVGVLTFSIYGPVTQANAIFSKELGNLLDAVYTLDGPNANEYLGAGGGQGTARVIVSGSDSTSVGTWGTVEGFLDARDTSDVPTISQRITAQLAQDAQQTNLSITPTDTAALTFGRDYNLGDVVSVQIDNTTITNTIRQLHIQLNSSDQELVTPGIGNAGAGQIAALFDAKQRALAAVQKQLTRLQTAQ